MKLNLDNFWLKLILFSIGAAIVWLIYTLIPLIGVNLPPPQITIKEATPCLVEDTKRISVEHLEEDKAQYICGEMITDTSPVSLTLLIYQFDNYEKSVYATSGSFTSGLISFAIENPLPTGKYRALIMYARTAFADIYFEVE
jgi:hypothetical protein